MGNLNGLEGKSIFILREAYRRFRNPALLWSGGKDSTTLLWLCRKSFYGRVPFKVLHIDTGYKFREIYAFRDEYKSRWGLDLVVWRNTELDGEKTVPENSRLDCCNARKTITLKQAVARHGFDALIVGIRWDEHGIRGKERFFSPRDRQSRWNPVGNKTGEVASLQDAECWNFYATDFGPDTDHVRVHPLLGWTELDVWTYIRQEGMPVLPLYFSTHGKRYRSVGCECCCEPVESGADTVEAIIEELRALRTEERSGRSQDKENLMLKLRSLGYM